MSEVVVAVGPTIWAVLKYTHTDTIYDSRIADVSIMMSTLSPQMEKINGINSYKSSFYFPIFQFDYLLPEMAALVGRDALKIQNSSRRTHTSQLLCCSPLRLQNSSTCSVSKSPCVVAVVAGQFSETTDNSKFRQILPLKRCCFHDGNIFNLLSVQKRGSLKKRRVWWKHMSSNTLVIAAFTSRHTAIYFLSQLILDHKGTLTATGQRQGTAWTSCQFTAGQT